MRDGANKIFWQRVSGVYGLFMKKDRKMYEEISREIGVDLNKSMTVLELACGTGQLSFLISKSVKFLEATDFSENMIHTAQRKPSPDNLRFSVQDATDLQFQPEIFDCVVIANALHIMPFPEKALSEIHRVLKPGGFLFAPTFVSQKGENGYLSTKMLNLLGFHTFHSWDDKSLTAFVAQNGFEPVDARMIHTGFLPLCCLKAKKQTEIFN
ncbi:class I SAM-dependent methyltransferase [Bacteroides xylanolyticus]|uniref:Class I SAM-dependent methyltransferase n=2 Tax=Lacrimispora defluvii TaxID=2719233 RepID=A0ABX1VS17_9FIRM|nr:class I SAM-dependent methyltransferase [Lacrimispora defluvii]